MEFRRGKAPPLDVVDGAEVAGSPPGGCFGTVPPPSNSGGGGSIEPGWDVGRGGGAIGQTSRTYLAAAVSCSVAGLPGWRPLRVGSSRIGGGGGGGGGGGRTGLSPPEEVVLGGLDVLTTVTFASKWTELRWCPLGRCPAVEEDVAGVDSACAGG